MMQDIDILLQGLKVDLDDDFYIVTQNKSQTLVFEAYKIRLNFDFITMIYGNFTEEIGLVFSSTEKWSRRRNLQVIFNSIF